MQKFQKIILFGLILFVGLTAVSAADIIDDDSSAVAVETPQVDQSNEETFVQESVQETDNNEEETQTYTGRTYTNPITITPSNYQIENEVMLSKISKNKKTESKTIGLNSTTFDTYVTNGSFNNLVSDGDTIDVNGKLDGEQFALTVNKSLNFISSNNQSYINVYTRSTGDFGEATGGQITFGHGASGSNITNLYFYNTRVTFSNVSNVNVNNISVIDYEAVIGSGTGHFIIGGQSDNVTIANSYFYTKDNGAHSTAVLSGCSNIVFENNTIIGVGSLGNLVYLNSFNVEDGASHSNFIIRNNMINASQAGNQITCFAICLTGSNILIDNNTVDYSGMSISPIFGGQGVLENITIQNNNLKSVQLGNGGIIGVKSINNTKLINNTISGLIISKSEESTHHSEIYNNTITGIRIEADDCIIEGNTLKTINNTGNNNIINNNTISNMQNYTIITTGENTTITNNKLASKDHYGDESINGTATTLENNVATSRIITITDDNIDEYTKVSTSPYGIERTITSAIKDGDVLIFKLNNTCPNILQFADDNFMPSLTIKDSVLLSDMISATFSTFINCSMPYAMVVPMMCTFINSTMAISYNDVLPMAGEESNPALEPILNNSIILTKLNESSHVILNSNDENHMMSNMYLQFFAINNFVDSSTGYLLPSVIEGDTLYFRDQGSITNLIIDRPVNLIGLGANNLKCNITFIEGSEGSNITNMAFDDLFILNTTEINYKNGNNVFNSLIIDNINNKTFGLNTTKKSVTINIKEINTLIHGEQTPITINITDMDNNIVNEGYIEIYTNGIYQNNVNLTEDNTIINISSDKIGNTTIKIWYYGKDNYLDNTTNITTETIKSNLTYILLTDIMNVGENTTLEAQIVSNNNKIVNEGNLTFIYKSNRYTANVINSTAKVNITVLESWYDKPTLTLLYSGSSIYNYHATTHNTTINKGKTNFQINNVTTQLGTTTQLEITITNKAGQKITNGIITLTDKNGKTLKTINLSQENTTTITPNSIYNGTITAQFQENKYYEDNRTTFHLTSTKPTTQLNITDVNLTAGKTVTLTSTLTDQLGNNITGGKVVFKVNGKTVKDTNGKVIYAKVVGGVATVEYSVPTTYADKELNITATYTGTSTYNKETATITKTATKPAPTLTLTPITSDIQSGSTIKIEAKVATGDVPITTGKIVFKLNGKTLKDANGKVIYAQVDSNGTVSFDYNIGNLKVNTYNLTATFISAGYDKLEANTTINVVKA